MSFQVLVPLLLTSASTGLTCGLSCGSCGTPVINVFLSSYLFTHSGKLKQGLFSFFGFHIGKAVTVSLLCAIISWFGSQIIDEKGFLFGIDFQNIVYLVMFLFLVYMILKWFQEQKENSAEVSCNGICAENKVKKNSFIYMLMYGLMSGLLPCTSLVIVLGYSASLSVAEAIFIGLCFSLANSIVPFLLLVTLTGILSKEMFQEIPAKIKYFQLATYFIFMIVLAYTLISSII